MNLMTRKVMNKYQIYSDIKRLVDEYFVFEDKKKYEDFINKLVMILKV